MLLRNQILTHVESGQNARILSVENVRDIVWLFQLTQPKALPQPYSLAAMTQALSNGLFAVYEADEAALPKKLSDAAIHRRDQAFKYIEPLIQHPGILAEETRGPLVKARASEVGCSEQTLYRYLRLWWQGGQSKQCLAPGFHRIGGIKGKTNGRGRPAVYADYSIYQVTEVDQLWMQEIIERFYLKDKIWTVTATYTELLKKHYFYLDGDGKAWLRELGECPSLNQFRQYINQKVPKELRIRARHGKAVFELEHRAKLGSLRASTYTVGEVFEIDATTVDFVLVHPHDRSKIIGKPTLYLIVDRKSGLIVGFYIGLESPCWIAAMQAIKSIAEDKETLCLRYNVHYDPGDWPAHQCFPQEFVADRGSDVMSGNSTQLADNLNIIVRNLPARRADWKPHVECGFKQIQRSLAHVVPGYTPPEDFGKRQVKDRSQGAALTLDEFAQFIIQKIIHHNNKPLANNPMSPAHVLNEIQPTPINIWNVEVNERAGAITRYSEAEVHFALLPQAVASVSREGIRVNGCDYGAPEALERGWFFRAGDKNLRKKVSYDLRLVDTIYVHDEVSPKGYFVATLLERNNHYRGLSVEEVEAVEKAKKRILHEGEATKRQLDADFKSIANPVIERAVAITKKDSKGKSRASHKKNIVGARTDARRIERHEVAQLDAGAIVNSEEHQPLTASDAASSLPKSRKERYQDLLDGK